MMDVMNTELVTRRLDGIDLYLWTRLAVGSLVLVLLAVLALALI
jgi:hypothetical protein